MRKRNTKDGYKIINKGTDARGNNYWLVYDPATGGRDGESLQEIKNNAAAYFQAQNRAVTKEDYMVRALSLPQRFGNIAKVYIVQDEQLNQAEEQVQEDTAAEQQTFEQQVNESSNVDVVKQQRTTEAGGGY